MKKLIILSICFLLLFGFAAFAQEQAEGQDVEEAVATGTNIDNYVAEEGKLGLTQDQKTKLKEIKDKLGQENSKLIKERNQIMSEIKTMMKEDEPDFGKVESRVRDLEKVRSQIMLNKLSAAKKADNVLTKEQKEKMKQVRAEKKTNLQKKGIKRPVKPLKIR